MDYRTAVIILMCMPLVFPMQEENKDGWNNHLELSYVRTTGNAENDSLAGKYNLKWTGGPDRLFADASLIVQNSDGRETANRLQMGSRYERTLTNRLFILGRLDYVRDKISGYEYRLSGGPGLGYDLVTGKKTAVKVYASALMYKDVFSVGELEDRSYFGIQCSVDSLFNPLDNFKAENNFDYFFSTEEGDNYFIENESSASVAVTTHIALGFSYSVRYDNQLAASDLERVNTTFLSSLIIDW
jgi:putative salt-induced outer membrane protein